MWFVGSLKTGGDAGYVKGAFIKGIQYAFLADGQKGLEIINITNATNPVLTSNYATNGFAKEVIVDSISSNKYAFLSDEVNGLFIFNVNNTSSPALDTLIAYPGGVNSCYSNNGLLYVALKTGLLKVLNINSLPDSIFEAGSYSPQYPVHHLEISGSSIYMLQKNYGFEIADISNPATPLYQSGFNTSGNCYDVRIVENIAYFANGTTGLCLMNVSVPSQPYLIGFLETESDVRGIDFSPSSFLLTAEYNFGTEVFNIFKPVQPYGFGYYEASGYCNGIHFFKNKVLVANGQNGLLILRY